MKSTAELNAEIHAEKIAAHERNVLKMIADGLNRIDSLDDDKIAEELPKDAYVKHAHEDLRRVMRKYGTMVPGDE